MISFNRCSAPQPGTTLVQLLRQTRVIQEAVVNSLVEQGHRHRLENSQNLEQALFQPISQMPESAPQEKGHQLQAWMHISRLDDALKAFDQESRRRFASRPDAQTGLQQIRQRDEQLTARIEERNVLLDRRTAWGSATPPLSNELDPITLLALPPAPLNGGLCTQDLKQAIKHVNALEKEIALLDSHIKQQPQPMSQVEENILIRQRNTMTEYRNAWATGLLKGSSQFKTAAGINRERKRLEQDLERARQLAPLELALHRLERTLENAHRSNLGGKFPENRVDSARNALIHLRDAWRDGSLDGTSENGMKSTLITGSNKRRLKLELAAIEKGYVQLDAVSRTEQAGNPQARLEFHGLIHSDKPTPLKAAAINQALNENKQRKLVADLNTELTAIYLDLRDNLVISRFTARPQ